MLYIGDCYKFMDDLHLPYVDHILGLHKNFPNTIYYCKYKDELITWVNLNTQEQYLFHYRKV
jgi:hypothetical protein